MGPPNNPITIIKLSGLQLPGLAAFVLDYGCAAVVVRTLLPPVPL